MGNISLKQLEAFVRVADLRSFRRAAEFLHTTQPNISTRISGLETTIDARLFERNAGSVRLTATGEALLPKARQVLQGLDEFVIAANNNQLFDGVLRLGVTEMVVHSWLGSYLSALKTRFPKIDVDLTVDLSENLSDALFNRHIDLALQNGPFERQTSAQHELGDYRFIWVGAPGLDFVPGPLALETLARLPLLTHARGTQPFRQLQKHLSASAHVPVRLVPSTNISACIQMTLEGLGVACLPEIMVQNELSSGTLVRLEYDWTPDALEFFARHEAEISPHHVGEAAALAVEISGAKADPARKDPAPKKPVGVNQNHVAKNQDAL